MDQPQVSEGDDSGISPYFRATFGVCGVVPRDNESLIDEKRERAAVETFVDACCKPAEELPSDRREPRDQRPLSTLCDPRDAGALSLLCEGASSAFPVSSIMAS